MLSSPAVLVLAATAVVQAAVEAQKFPLYNVSTAESWIFNGKALGTDVYLGDIRAVLSVNPQMMGKTVTGQVFWRRRDPNPEKKVLVVTTSTGDVLKNVHPVFIEQGCGIFSFDASQYPKETTFYLYWLPHVESGGGAHTQFHWLNCTQADPSWCVLSDKPLRMSDAGCNTTMESDFSVMRLENRPNNVGSKDHTPSGESFHGYTQMEFTALEPEMNAMLDATGGQDWFRVFMADRKNHVRIFRPRAGISSALPAVWARSNAEILTLSDTAMIGEYFTFQIGIFTPGIPANNISLQFGKLMDNTGADSAARFNCFNLGGVDEHGVPFTKAYSVSGNGSVGSMWIGVALPSTMKAGSYSASIVLAGSGRPGSVQMKLNLDVIEAPGGGAVPNQGDDDVYKMTRLRWLDSTIGIDDNVTMPFTPIKVSKQASSIVAQTVNKVVTIAANGLIQSALVSSFKTRRGKPVTETYNVFASPVVFELITSSGIAVPLTVTQPATIVSQTDADLMWTSTMSAPGVKLQLNGSLDFTSYVETIVTLTGDATLSDIRLRYEVASNDARYILGMGREGSQFDSDVVWTWNNNSGECDSWMGRMEAGVYVKLKGAGTHWDNPQYSKDYPIIPFIPPSWGGVKQQNGMYGANISAPNATSNQSAIVEVYAGPHTLTAAPCDANTFKFDFMITPSKPLNMSTHWGDRYFQVGYGTPYKTPQEMKDIGATVVTLHQGIPGIINGTMVNPYINWPFVPEVVDLLENYTSQSHDLGMRVKFYYTIRELTNHAVELFALKALQGEIITDGDPYTVPQAGYCHDWDCHGGSFYLHEHVVSDYIHCWQQGLPNGEWDASVCDMGVSRWFNYYVSGVEWSVRQAPHIDGIYYDGINFDRRSFRRIRKLLDSQGSGARVDIHTGEVPDSPSSVRYIGHFPFANTAWNGEGFHFNNDRYYWLVDASGFQHGITADRLGGTGLDIRGMLFSMYQRNSGTAPAIWKFWDESKIQDSTMIGWWEDDIPVKVNVTTPAPTPSPPSNCTGDMLKSKIVGGYRESSGPGSSIGFGPLGNQGCGAGTTNHIPPMNVDEAIKYCCASDTCDGFSIKQTSPPGGKSTGCIKTNLNGGTTRNPDYDGYSKMALPPGPSSSCADEIVATVFTTFGLNTTIVLGSWCPVAANVGVSLELDALGLAQPYLIEPAIDGVQSYKDHGLIGPVFTIEVPPTGLILAVY